MKYKNIIHEFFTTLNQLEKDQKRNIFITSLVMFLLLFSYPMVRSATDAIFLNQYGAYKSPFVWLYSVIGITFFIWLYDRWQKTWSVKKIHFLTGALSFCIILICNYLISHNVKIFSYFLYIWKEAYIVLLIHLTLAFFNNSIDLKIAKIVYGPLGAIGSIGGILGGLLTSRYTHIIGVEYLLLIGAFFIFLSSVAFSFIRIIPKVIVSDKTIVERQKNKNKSVLKSILGIKEYVLAIALIVMMSQFSINLLNYKLNIWIVKELVTKQQQTEYFGMLYSLVNLFSLVLQILVIPLLFKYVKLSKIHFLMPMGYLTIFWGGILFISGNLLPVAIAFVCFKGNDYSLFNAAKELLYFNLDSQQKYGAKYIIDMFVYRLSKGLISVILIFVKTVQTIDLLLTTTLVIWFFLLIGLFNKTKTLQVKNKNL